MTYVGLIPGEDLFVDGRVRFNDAKRHFDLFVDAGTEDTYSLRTWADTGVNYSATPVDVSNIGLSGKVVARIAAGLSATAATSYTIVADTYARYQGDDPMKEGASHRTGGIFDAFGFGNGDQRSENELTPFITRRTQASIPRTDQLELLLLIDHDKYVMAQTADLHAW